MMKREEMSLIERLHKHGDDVRMAAERLSCEAQTRSTGMAGEEERLRSKMGSIAADLFRLGAPLGTLIESLEARIGEAEKVANAGRAFLAKYEECEPHINDAFLHRQLRCGEYRGPQYGEELAALRAHLESTRP